MCRMREKFSKVSSVRNVLHATSGGLIFENFYLGGYVAVRGHVRENRKCVEKYCE